MASAAEQLASNISLAGFSKATELKKRLWFTLGALILFRFLSYVPMPGVDPVDGWLDVAKTDNWRDIRNGVERGAQFVEAAVRVRAGEALRLWLLQHSRTTLPLEGQRCPPTQRPLPPKRRGDAPALS